LPALLAASSAAADCKATGVSLGGNTLESDISRSDIERLSSRIDEEPSHVVCGYMHMSRRGLRVPLLNVRRGFFALTEEEAVFVADRRGMELLFRVGFADIDDIASMLIGLDQGFDMLQLFIFTEEGYSAFDLTLDGGASDVVQELRKRARIP